MTTIEERKKVYKWILEECINVQNPIVLVCPNDIKADLFFNTARMMQEEGYIKLFINANNEISVQITNSGAQYYNDYLK